MERITIEDGIYEAKIVPREYEIGTVPSDKLEQLHRDGPSFRNADIVLLKYGQEEKRKIYSDYLAYLWNAELPKLPVRYRDEGKEKIEVLGGEEPPDLRKGIPPIKQFLHRKCGIDGKTEEEIFSLVFEDYRWFPNTSKWKDEIREELEWLDDKNMIIEKDNVYHTLPKTGFENLGGEGFPLERGPYPVCRLIREKVSERDRERVELVEIVYVDWKWVSVRKAANFWINYCKDEGYIKEIEENKFVPGRRIE